MRKFKWTYKATKGASVGLPERHMSGSELQRADDDGDEISVAAISRGSVLAL